MKGHLAVLVGVALGCTGTARAEVTRVDITKRADIGQSGYEKVAGTVHFSVDPRSPRNAVVVDLDKAPRAAGGRVEFSADLYIIRPKDPTRGNGSVLVEVSNRGGRSAIRTFNRGGPSPDPENDADLGDKFLMRFGFTIAWVGWEFDIADGPERMRIKVPVATDAGKPITGVVRASFTPNAPATESSPRELEPYDAIDPDGPDSLLTVRSTSLGKSEPVARNRWRVKGHTIALDGGFEPGKTYEVSYRVANPPVAGLGFVAVRDFASWLKHDRRDVSSVRYAIAYGSSQSGRFLRGFLYEGFNTDDRDRQVFDGVMAHIAGAARIDLNARWSSAVGLNVYSSTGFPFADAAQRDPVSGATEGLLENPRARMNQPKVFYTNTPVEYWGTGRVAALIHTTPDGTADLPLPDNVRVYFLAGTQHGPARFPATVNNGQQPDNPVEYVWVMRALLLAMQRWVSAGTAPPASAYPMLKDGTLVKASAVGFPAIPGVASPSGLTGGPRMANPFIKGGAGAGAPLPLLVPAVDQDGNERAGIRLPDVALPLATYTGWNFRNATIGASGDLVSLLGSAIPFPATRAARESTKDPRRSIEERYASRDAYLAEAEKLADALVLKGYVLIDDLPRILQRTGDTWDVLADAKDAKVAKAAKVGVLRGLGDLCVP
jgi:alpha/beta hydrolase family protein